MASTPVVFQASDLNQKARAVLDAGRAGPALIRDKDGLALILTRETAYRTLNEIAEVSANLIAVEQALAIERPRRTLRDFAAWTWLRHFDDDDLAEFVASMRDALLVAIRERSNVRLDEELRRWRVTAEQLSDEKRRSVLLGIDQLALQDFIEVDRPEMTDVG